MTRVEDNHYRVSAFHEYEESNPLFSRCVDDWSEAISLFNSWESVSNIDHEEPARATDIIVRLDMCYCRKFTDDT